MYRYGVPTLSRGMQFTEQEWCYCLWHEGWRPAPVPTGTAPSLWVRCALDTKESQRKSDAYLERKKNTVPGADGCVGYDIGISMYNERLNGQAAALPDAFVLFDWRESARLTLAHARANPTKPFGPWAYPSASRNDSTLGIAALAERVGPNPYAIEHSPYYRMRALGVPVHDLPVPPPALWLSPLPAAPLKVGDSGSSIDDVGQRINALQKRLAFEGVWVGGAFNWYYGTDWVPRSLARVQTRLASLGLWNGPLDGRVYSEELRTVWDGVLRYQHLIEAGG